jgi:hypothetical protein
MKFLRHFASVAGSYFHPSYSPSLVYLLETSGYSVHRYLGRYWSIQNFSEFLGRRPTPNTRNKAMVFFVLLGSLMQALLGVVIMSYGGFNHIAGSIEIGLALVLSYPFVWAHMLGLFYAAHKLLWMLLNPKPAGKLIVSRILENQVIRSLYLGATCQTS